LKLLYPREDSFLSTIYKCAKDIIRYRNLIGCPSTTDIPASEALPGIDWEGKLLKWDEEEGYVPTDTLCANEGRFLWRGEETVWDIPLIPNDSDTVSYVYDGDGGRVKRIASDEVATYIGSSYEVTTTSEGSKIKKHIFLGSTRIVTVEYEQGDSANSEYRYFHQDHIGSSNVITDSNGQLAQLLEYTPYGLTAREEGSYNTDCKFTGKLFDTYASLYYYGARYYDPHLGRFIQPDTIVPYPTDPQSFNRYAYARNNPIRYIDPTGHSWWDSFKSWIGSIVGIFAGIFITAISGNFWLGLQTYSFWSGAINSAMSGDWGAFAGGMAGSIIGGVFGLSAADAGYGLFSKAVLGTTMGKFVAGFAVGAIEAGFTGFGAGFGAALGLGQGMGDAFISGAISAGISAPIGGILEATYLSGMQEAVHGLDEEALERYSEMSTEELDGYVNQMNAKGTPDPEATRVLVLKKMHASFAVDTSERVKKFSVKTILNMFRHGLGTALYMVKEGVGFFNLIFADLKGERQRTTFDKIRDVERRNERRRDRIMKAIYIKSRTPW